ncbi:MAG: ABC transporter permease [Gammaproteobacteria bacterium]|nr:ABC transporter permease [Gammaproteobacteria bacterium]
MSIELALRRFRAVLSARNKEFMRDRTALGWSFLFPVLVVAGFAFAFSGEPPAEYKVGVIGAVPATGAPAFYATRHIDFIPAPAPADAVTKVERHQLDMLVDPAARSYWINDSSPKGYLLERILRGSGGGDYRKQTVSGRAVRYVDWVIPGILAMNMMFGALYGVGYVIVRYRKNGVLKRLKATPLNAVEFLAAQLASRLWLLLTVATLVYAGTNLFIGFTMNGRYLDLAVVFLLGATSLLGLGLVIAARISNEEVADGLVSFIGWPMMFLSGVWFSLEGLHPWLQQLALALPLTHFINAARAIMIDGAGLAEVAPDLAVLGAMSIAFLALGAWLFRWEQA